MAEITLGAPPADALKPGRRAGGKYGEIAAVLRENPVTADEPDNYANLGAQPTLEAARNLASQIQRGKRKGFEDGPFDARVDAKSFEVWVGYTPDDTED